MQHIFTELNKGSIGNFTDAIKERMDKAVLEGKIKIVKPTTLFDVEPSWEMLNERRCPICGNKLLLTRNGLVAFCKGLRHGDKKRFVITREKLEGTKKVH